MMSFRMRCLCLVYTRNFCKLTFSFRVYYNHTQHPFYKHKMWSTYYWLQHELCLYIANANNRFWTTCSLIELSLVQNVMYMYVHIVQCISIVNMCQNCTCRLITARFQKCPSVNKCQISTVHKIPAIHRAISARAMSVPCNERLCNERTVQWAPVLWSPCNERPCYGRPFNSRDTVKCLFFARIWWTATNDLDHQ